MKRYTKTVGWKIQHIKMSTLSEFSWRVKAKTIKIPAEPFCPLDGNLNDNLKFSWKCQGPRIVKISFRKKGKTIVLFLPDFQEYSMEKHKSWWNRREIPEINAYVYY